MTCNASACRDLSRNSHWRLIPDLPRYRCAGPCADSDFHLRRWTCGATFRSWRNAEHRQRSPVSFTFVEAETCFCQGSTAEAKSTVLEQLQQRPDSVEGYNFLGIIYSNEQDFANALEAFQHAMKLAPNSTKTRNNLGNLYAAEGKLDLAENEFAKQEVLSRETTMATTTWAWY